MRVGVESDRPRRARAHVAAVDSGGRDEMHTLETSLAVQVYPFRAMYWVATALGVIALLLTLTGVYGVLRTSSPSAGREFGIRMALGAGGSSVDRAGACDSRCGCRVHRRRRSADARARRVAAVRDRVLVHVHTFDALVTRLDAGSCWWHAASRRTIPSRRAAP